MLKGVLEGYSRAVFRGVLRGVLKGYSREMLRGVA